MYQPKVSIITVCYNSFKTIRKTIECVINQTYKNIEYIIIDGNSDDGTQDIIKSYKNQIAFWSSEPDSGIYDAMNKGIQAATGKIIGIINSDDWYSLETVEKIVSCFKLSDAEVIYGDILQVYPNNQIIQSKLENLSNLNYKMVIPHPAVFVKKEVYKRLGSFNLKYKIAADYELMLRFYKAGVRFKYINTELAYFRIGGTSYSNAELCAEEIKNIALENLDVSEKEKHLPLIHEYYENSMKICKLRRILSNEGKTEPIRQTLLNWGIPKEGAVIFGTGMRGMECYSLLKKCNIKIKTFADNDADKWNQTFAGIMVSNPDILLNKMQKVIISTTNYLEEVEKQLLHMGYHKKKDFISLLDIINEFI